MQSLRMECNATQYIELVEIPDLDFLIMVAIGSRYSLHDGITEVYRQNREMYYDYFRKSPYFHDKRLASLSFRNYRGVAQFIGIYLAEQYHQHSDTTMKFIKKGYRFVYNFVNNHLKVDFYKLRDQYMDYVKRNLLETNIHAAHLFGIALYLCKELKKEIIFDEFDLSMMKDAIGQVFLELETKPDENLAGVDEFLEHYRQIGIKKRDFSLPLKDLVIAMNKIHQEGSRDIEQGKDEMKPHDFYKGLSQIALILQYCNINPLDLQNITSMDESTLRQLVSLSISAKKLFQLTEDVHSLLGSYLLVYALANDYNETKHNLLITSQEETQQELSRLKTEYKKKLKKLHLEEKDKERRIRQLEDSNKRLIEEMERHERNTVKQEKIIEEKKDTIASLENVVAQLRGQSTRISIPLDTPKNEEELLAVLREKKCVVVGGLKNWQEGLKEVLPTVRLIQPEELSIDLDFIQDADLILFNEVLNNHAMFAKVKAKLARTEIPLVYSGSNTNRRITLQKMVDGLNK